jgi:type IV pilus assembly protein PilB
MIQFDEEKQRQRLDDLHHKDEEEFTRVVAEKQGKRYIDLRTVPVDPDALRLLLEKDAREARIVSFSMQDKTVRIGQTISETDRTQEVLESLRLRGYTIVPFLISDGSLQFAFERYKELSFAVESKAGAVDISNEEIMTLLMEVRTVEDIKTRIDKVLTEKKSYKISRIVEIILAGALATSASDIHIEPEEKGAVLRYRLDGVLHIILHFDHETYDLVINRLKLLSGLKINVRNNAQDGRFSVTIKEDTIDLRVSTLPGSHGESAVMRVLNQKSIRVSIEELGIEPKLLEILMREIDRPNGMILTTGPTGSGKTTTLYSFLRKVYTPELKIITIENPVEYHLDGIVQSQTDAARGFTFSEGLRSAVRQDPDIIMVGEIRDNETASTAIDAALTGHLVFSTLHTNSAAGAYTRLIDLGINPKVLTSALTVSIAQRLARKLCEHCKERGPAKPDDKVLLEKILATITDREHPTTVEKLWYAPGCDRCNQTGFKGRIGIYEAILSNQKIEAALSAYPSEREIRKASEDQGILTLVQDAAIKITAGLTSVAEVQRVIDLSAE